MEPLIRRGFDDFRTFVNPWIALRAEMSREPVRVLEVRGGQLVDEDGHRFDDLIAGYGSQSLGHRNPVVAAAVREFLDGTAPSFYTSGVSPYAGALARRLCERTGYHRAFFASGGGEAIEAALKLARAATRRPRILHVDGAWHGCTFGGTAMMPNGVYKDRFGPHLPAVDSVPFGDVAALEATLARGDVAALLVEPVQMEAGVRAPTRDWLEAAGELTARHGVLLIADEVQTGLGRTGYFLASERWPRLPDAVVIAKALGGGLLPISCVLGRAEAFDRAYGSHRMAEAHNTTFGGNALCCVAALATLDLLTDDLFARVRDVGARFRTALADALSDLESVRSVRGEGLLVGIEMVPTDHPWLGFEYLGLPELADQPAIGMLLCHRFLEAGFLASVCGHSWETVRLQPAFDIPEARLMEFVGQCRADLRFLEALA